MSDMQPNTAALGEAQEQEEPAPPAAPIIVLKASPDNMQLELMLYQNGETRNPELEELKEAIAQKGVVYGVNEIILRAVCRSPAYSRPMIIAKGTPPTTGEDGYLKYLIRQKKEFKPKLKADGTVDYRDLGLIQNVQKGQALCEIHMPKKGKDGQDIYGNVLEGRLGSMPIDPSGRNTVYNEDRTLLLAGADGNAEVVNGIIHVIDVMRVPGHVDNSTGNIDFIGDVIINGDVLGGFKVVSGGSVTVKGSVESATIQAAKDILVGEGINGMGRGSIVAGGNLRCRYIQSSYVRADENIYADSIMYCTLECGGNVELGGKRAVLIGGRSTIAGRLLAKTIGTNSHVATNIIMASTGTKMNQEIMDLESELKRIDADNIKLLQIMARFEDLMKQGRVGADQVKTIQTVRDNYVAQVEKRNSIQRHIEQIKKEQLEASRENSYIDCQRRIHVGVQITFGPLTMSVQTSFVNSRVCIVNDEIGILYM